MSNGIYKAIADAMADITPIAKEKRNKEQGFLYRGIDDIMNELSPILTKHRIFIYPEVLESNRSERQTQKGGTLLYSILTIKYHFATDDGSEVCTVVVGEAMDTGDKASNKAMAVAFKYACLQMFCIPTEEMTDPDGTTPPPSTKPEPKKPEHKNGNGQTEKGKLGDEIGMIIKSVNADQKPFFTEKEIEAERELFKKTADIQQIKNQHERLKKELERRQVPAMFMEPEIPWEQPMDKDEIF